MGYVDLDGTPHYKVIGRDLDELKEFEFIDSRKEKMERKSGNIPTLHSIFIDIQNMKLILAKYPRLISEMQKNDLVLESIFTKGGSLIVDLVFLELIRCENYRNSNLHIWGTEVTKFEKDIKDRIGDSNITFDPDTKEMFKRLSCTVIEKIKEDFKIKLRLSPEFFRLFVMKDDYELMIYIDACIEIFEDGGSLMHHELYLAKDKYTYLKNCIEKCEKKLGTDMIFEACINTDMMQRQSNQKAKEYLKLKKKGLISIN